MRKFYVFFLVLLTQSIAYSQVFYSENIGIPSASATAIASYTGWQNTSVSYSGTGSVRKTGVSTGYVGASGNGNIFLTNTSAGIYFQIDGLNTSSYASSDIQMTFGYLTTDTAVQLTLEQSTDGGNTWNPISFTQNTNQLWNLVTIPGGQIASSNNLKLRFTQPSTAQMRIDDIALANVSASCTFSFGTATSNCNTTTLALDTYTATIPFTGAGNATYTVLTTSGTVSGDNPTSNASGNILISGITEGTNITVTVTGGSCNISLPVTAAICKPVNTLPYYEAFNYAISNILGDEQRWSSVNSGDDIVVASGNLSYPGITSSGNSIKFDGDGKSCHSPFTPTSTGKLFSSFLLNVTDNTTVNDGEQTYFAVLTDGGSTGSNYKTRIFIKKIGTQYQLGMSSAASATTTNFTTALYNLNEVVNVVVGYDFSTDILKMWINPNTATFTDADAADLTDTPAAEITTLGGFMFRQNATITTPFLIIDELRIANSTAALLSTTENSISGLSLYPNPANDILNIRTNSNSVKTVTIYDTVGKQVINTTTENGTINTSSLHTGVYIIKITEEGKTATRKLIIK